MAADEASVAVTQIHFRIFCIAKIFSQPIFSHLAVNLGRETANIRDGSRFTADMAVQNFIGDACRGATWVSLHNGGGVGWGEVMNGGFGLVLDGSEAAGKRAESMLFWDVNNGVSRRAWGRNANANFAIRRAMAANPSLQVTLPNEVDDSIITSATK